MKERWNDKRNYYRDKDYTKAKEKENDIEIHYVQHEPAEFSFKLDTLTVSSAVKFLEKYNQMIRSMTRCHITVCTRGIDRKCREKKKRRYFSDIHGVAHAT